MNELLRIENISKNVFIKKTFFNAKQSKSIISDVSFRLNEGEIISIIGQSGAGKTTLAKVIAQLDKHSSGKIIYRDRDISETPKKKIQMIFQDPYSTLNPIMRVKEILEEPLKINNITCDIERSLRGVGLDSSILDKYPHELSGGQKQRIAIARALILEPELLICDEALSSVDEDNKKLIITILKNLKQNKVSIILIEHDLILVKELSDYVAIMLDGKLVELGTTNDIYNNPKHIYTKELLGVYN